MIQRTISRFAFLGLFAAGSCLMSGCDEATTGLLRAATDQIGANLVSRSSNDDLRKMFEKTNETCPLEVDIYTTLQSVELIDDTHAEFRYLVSDDGKKFAAQFDKRAMKAGAVEYLKGKAMAVAVAERDLSIHHIYEDRAGNHVLSYIINKAVLEGDLEPLGDKRTNPFNVNTIKTSASQSVNTGTPARQRGNRVKPSSNPAGVQDNPYF